LDAEGRAEALQPKIRFISGTSARKWRKIRSWFRIRVPKEQPKIGPTSTIENLKGTDLQAKKAAEGIRTLDLLHGN
jgi:hypothetical protein